MANWYAYYRTRMQLMKSSIGRTFSDLDKSETLLLDESEGYRIGFITVEGYNTAGNYLPIKDFLNGTNNQKEQFFKNVYSRWPAGGTALRDVLGTVGRIYAGQHPVTGFANDDPMQQSCQQNFTLLTTDGYWNGDPGQSVTGGAIPNQDGGSTPKPFNEVNSAPDTLADVAQYYYQTDIRDTAFGNCAGAVSSNVCINDVKPSGDDTQTQQHMTTYTLGLGVDGLLNSTGYKVGKSDDYNDIKSGPKGWTVPGPDNGDTTFTSLERGTVDDLWHAAVNGRGEYFSAKNYTTLRDSIKSLFDDIDSIKGSRSAIAINNTVVEAGGDADYAYVAKYDTDGWTGNLIARELIVNAGPPKSVSLNQNVVWCVENETAVLLSLIHI